MKTGYVTGATGCVGRNLVDVLLKEGWKVIVLHRKSSDLSRLRDCNVIFKEVDFYDPRSVDNSIEDNKEAIFHVAGNTSHWSEESEIQWKDNVLVTENLVNSALKKKINRFIFTSTGATHHFQKLSSIKDANIIKNSYVRTKRIAEMIVQNGVSKGLNAIILQPIIVVGPYDYNSYAQIFENMKKSLIRIAFPGRIAFCHAVDVARAHISAYENGKNGTVYMLGGTYTTWHETFSLICKKLNVSAPIVMPKFILVILSHIMLFISKFTKTKPLLTPELVQLIEDTNDVPNEEKLRALNELRYQSQSLEAMVQDCYHWLKMSGRI